jgi:hypothetical protein
VIALVPSDDRSFRASNGEGPTVAFSVLVYLLSLLAKERPMKRCRLCGGRGHRVIATISDTHWGADGDGRPTLIHSFAIPIVVPCLCTAEHAEAAGMAEISG